MNLRSVVCLSAGLSACLLAACSTRQPAPVAERNPREMPKAVGAAQPAPVVPDPSAAARERTHVVQKGETLIAIALQHGLDYKELAAWNGIENVNLIHAGQELRLAAAAAAPTTQPAVAPGGVVATPIQPSTAPVARPIDAPAPAQTPSPAGTSAATPPGDPGDKTGPRAIKLPYSDKAMAELEADAKAQLAASPGSTSPAGTPGVIAAPSGTAPGTPASTPANDKTDKPERLNWAWPVKGKLLSPYSEATKGIDIAGSAGAPVLAAADGKVMYSGTGIRGYGKLVILKHNNEFLSAYAHNQNILVKEGQDVKQGQKIAEMGSTDTDQVKLHFEIRRQGKPVDPTRILPSP